MMKKSILLLLTGGMILTGCSQKENKEAEEKETVEKSLGIQEDGTYSFTRNNHDYNFEVVSGEDDVISGATAPKKDDVGDPKYGETFTGEEKEKRMHWSGRPYKDVVVGDYYRSELDFDGGYIASAEVIVKEDTIQYVLLDEKAPGDYYASDWGGKTKRLSGYAGFQAASERTDATLVTLVNSMQIIEDQAVNENRLSGSFYSVKGATNSVNQGFLPLLDSMSEDIKTPSKFTYYGVSKDLGNGLFGQLVIIKDKESNEIVEARYDEFFADSKDDIKDDNLKDFYRQSKLASPSYLEYDSQFSVDTETLISKILSEQSIDVNVDNENLNTNYQSLVTEMNKIIK